MVDVLVSGHGYSGNMRKGLVAIVVSILAMTGFTSAEAAPKSSVVTAAFKTLLNTTADSIDSLDEKYEADVSVLDDALIAATKAADATLALELQAATSLYSPQIASANQRLEAAKTLFLNNSDLKIQQSLFSWQNADRVYPYFTCPDSTLPAGAGWMEIAKRSCSNVNNKPRPGDISTKTTSKNTVGGEDWQPGEIAKITLTSVENKDILFAISNGWLVPVNQSVFDSSRLAIGSETSNVADLVQKNGKARTAAQTKRDNAVTAATAVRADALENLDEAYESAKAQLEAQQTAANLALLAAKRASKDPSNFDVAFATAYKFEYNRQMVGEIADAAWTGDWTFRTIDSIIKVNKLAVTGDAIGNKYSLAAAKSFNSMVGNAFTNEPDFRAALKVLTGTYKKTTKVTLKF
ncbi:MAG: hypothetical protein F2704_00020 [Actinobacteria bacterium]|uniref:Unannotated protein n=1 Tax=freshwater metagenome TaxID=449393 RepID=A0A6J6SUX8_9ZZZZ|nr:hypothetical protein [Actinomycetota bacterium]MSY56639.1 hypothetical protein [Actinomycetota bacterium]